MPAAALAILVPAGLGVGTLLSSSGEAPTHRAAGPGSTASAPAYEEAESDGAGAVVAQPTDRPDRRVHSASVRVAAYDPGQRRAVLKATERGAVRAGDVVASAPTRSAPAGALFKVAKVTESRGDEVTVTTAPATLPELLGERSVKQRAAIPARELSVRPLSKGVTATTDRPSAAESAPASPSPADSAPADPAPPTDSPSSSVPTDTDTDTDTDTGTGTDTGTDSTGTGTDTGTDTDTGTASPAPSASSSPTLDTPAKTPSPSSAPAQTTAPGLPREGATPLTTLRLALDVPLPAGIEATDRSPARLAGEVRFTPEVFFQYEKRGGLSVLPERAAVGLGGSYGYDWQVHGKVSRAVDSGEITRPLAAVTGRHTFWVGPVPVVVNTEVVFVYRFTADGRIVLDADQRTTGSFDIGARYDRAQGWQPVRHAEQRTEGDRPRVEGAATAQAVIGARAKVSLYDAAGVGGDLSVQLRGRASAASDGKPAWELTAGYDLKTELMLQLQIFGISVVDLRTTPFTLRGERRLFGQGTPEV
ncbi:hypothetical protein GL263_08795 [Streptomyces durbertensis]|uniref:Lipoprotein n=1 Tax=Streptomyces durbertensis TaxID=2448886 RepID=A0ABR6EEA7_9ACTN|nr:hypothetical protein [Streptomyces durbertensis]